MNLRFNFDETIERRKAPALKTHPMGLGTESEKLIAAGVADIDFAVAQPIVEAVNKRVAHRVFGYEAVLDGVLCALSSWLETWHGRLTANKNNAFASIAMLTAYRDGAPWLDAVARYLEGNLDLVRQELSTIRGVRLIGPDGTFLLWLDFRELGLDAAELDTFLRHGAGWVVMRGIAFGEEGAGFARLNIACPRQKLKEAFAWLTTAMNGNAR